VWKVWNRAVPRVWAGNTVLTAHAFKADGKPGPFALLKNLKYGDKVIIHFGSLKYTYEIRTNFLVKPTETKWITKHETLDWITMITCQQYDEAAKDYLYRRITRAVLVSVVLEK